MKPLNLPSRFYLDGLIKMGIGPDFHGQLSKLIDENGIF